MILTLAVLGVTITCSICLEMPRCVSAHVYIDIDIYIDIYMNIYIRVDTRVPVTGPELPRGERRICIHGNIAVYMNLYRCRYVCDSCWSRPAEMGGHTHTYVWMCIDIYMWIHTDVHCVKHKYEWIYTNVHLNI